MKKYEQLCENLHVLDAIDRFNDRPSTDILKHVERLRSCSADVYETNDYYVLRSYQTIIAIIDKETEMCYDFLRYVYGYTSTSAQHIAKFMSDYGDRRKHRVYREV